MGIQQVLQQLNSQVLEQISLENHWMPLPVEELADCLLKEMEQIWAVLSWDEKRILYYFLFRFPNEPITYRGMDALARTHSSFRVYRGLTGLRRKGIVFTLRRLWGEMAFFVPEDLAIGWRHFIYKKRPASELPFSFSTGQALEEPPLCDVVFSFLHSLRYQPVTLTKKGEVPLRVRRLWQGKVPNPDWFLPFLEEGGWILRGEKEGQQLLKIDEKACSFLFTGSQDQVQRKLYETLKNGWIKQVPFYYVIFEQMKEEMDAPFSFRTLKETWQKDLQRFGWDAPTKHWDEFSQQVIPMLITFGFFLDKSQEGDEVFQWQWTSYEMEDIPSKIGYVQPTFEVLLFPIAPYDVRWAIGEYCQLHVQQEMWIFRLEKEQACQVRGSQREKSLLQVLSRVQGDHLPENVQLQIAKWFTRQQEVQVSRATLLRCPDKQLADRLEGMAWSGIEERLNDTLFLVDENQLNPLKKELKKLEIFMGTKVEEPVLPLPLSSHALAKEEKEGDGYNVESVFPTLEDVLPQLREVPSLWKKNRQKYHASTLRLFIEKARSLGVPLFLETKGGEWESVYIKGFLQEQGLDVVYFTDEKEDHRTLMMDIGRVQMKI